MTSLAILTREQYLQHRKDASQIALRKGLLPYTLFLVPLFTLVFVFGKSRPPSNTGELVLFWSLAFIGLVGLVWCYIRMFLDHKINAINCPSCGKNNGGHKASRWLIASGKCFKCGQKMLHDVPAIIAKSDETTFVSRADYEERLKRVEHTFLRASLYVCVPLLVALIWLARQYLSPTGPGPYHEGIMLGALGIAAIVLVILYERLLGCSQINCPKCSSNPLRNGSAKIVLSTGCCAKCGHPMFTSQRLEGGIA